jgi:hypothetical protein
MHWIIVGKLFGSSVPKVVKTVPVKISKKLYGNLRKLHLFRLHNRKTLYWGLMKNVVFFANHFES